MQITTAARALLIVAVPGIILVSMSPLRVKHAIGADGVLHSFGHFAAFALCALLYLMQKPAQPPPPWTVWPVVGFAAAVEWLEATLFQIRFEWRDLRSDLTGVLMAGVAYWIWSTRARRGKR